MKYHSQFDPIAWAKQHRLTNFDWEALRKYFGISNPGSIAATFQVRNQIEKKGIDLGKPTPVDLCVWNWGDSKSRLTTKIGGTPFWPKRCRWHLAKDLFPDSGDETPLTFVGQICFADSRELFPSLPGDILVLLSCWENYANTAGIWFRFDDRPLLPAKRVPQTPWRLPAMHASLCRSFEFADYPWKELEAAGLNYGPALFWHCTSTKIGGICPGNGGEYAREENETDQEYAMKTKRFKRQLQRKYLATIFSPEIRSRSWPFINIKHGRSLPKNGPIMMIADVGGMSIFRDNRGIRVEISSG